MSGDFSHRPSKHDPSYSRVLMQQGRMLLDADWNAQADLLARRERTLIRDLVGPIGVPAQEGGFEVSVRDGRLVASPGRIYVEGLLCESSEETEVSGASAGARPGIEWVFLEVWERAVGAAEDPTLRDPALAGADTCLREKVEFRVHRAAAGRDAASDPGARWEAERTSFIPSSDARLSTVDPASDAAGRSQAYGGIDNLLVRVEIHGVEANDTSAVGVFIKHSSVNASRRSRATFLGGTESVRIRLEDPLPGTMEALREGDLIELAADPIHAPAGWLATIEGIYASRAELELKAWASPDAPVPNGDPPTAPQSVWTWIHWDGCIRSVIADGEATRIALRSGDALDDALGELGVLPEERAIRQLTTPVNVWLSGRRFRAGDYWTFRVRAATQRVEPLLRNEPHGPRRVQCPLALVVGDATEPVVHDLRPLILSTSNQRGLVYESGDGQSARPNQRLEKPLVVIAQSGHRGLPHVEVSFQIVEGKAALLDADGTVVGATLRTRTDAPGRARCHVHMGGAPYAPVRVEARWVQDERDEAAARVGETIVFRAEVAHATHLAFGSTEPPRPTVHTVDEALLDLYATFDATRNPRSQVLLDLARILTEGLSDPDWAALEREPVGAERSLLQITVGERFDRVQIGAAVVLSLLRGRSGAWPMPVGTVELTPMAFERGDAFDAFDTLVRERRAHAMLKWLASDLRDRMAEFAGEAQSHLERMGLVGPADAHVAVDCLKTAWMQALVEKLDGHEVPCVEPVSCSSPFGTETIRWTPYPRMRTAILRELIVPLFADGGDASNLAFDARLTHRLRALVLRTVAIAWHRALAADWPRPPGELGQDPDQVRRFDALWSQARRAFDGRGLVGDLPAAVRRVLVEADPAGARLLICTDAGVLRVPARAIGDAVRARPDDDAWSALARASELFPIELHQGFEAHDWAFTGPDASGTPRLLFVTRPAGTTAPTDRGIVALLPLHARAEGRAGATPTHQVETLRTLTDGSSGSTKLLQLTVVHSSDGAPMPYLATLAGYITEICAPDRGPNDSPTPIGRIRHRHPETDKTPTLLRAISLGLRDDARHTHLVMEIAHGDGERRLEIITSKAGGDAPWWEGFERTSPEAITVDPIASLVLEPSLSIAGGARGQLVYQSTTSAGSRYGFVPLAHLLAPDRERFPDASLAVRDGALEVLDVHGATFPGQVSSVEDETVDGVVCVGVAGGMMRAYRLEASHARPEGPRPHPVALTQTRDAPTACVAHLPLDDAESAYVRAAGKSIEIDIGFTPPAEVRRE